MATQSVTRNTLTVSEAAKRLGVSVRTLHNWDQQGKFCARRHPINGYRLYDSEALEQLAQRLGGLRWLKDVGSQGVELEREIDTVVGSMFERLDLLSAMHLDERPQHEVKELRASLTRLRSLAHRIHMLSSAGLESDLEESRDEAGRSEVTVES